MSMELFVLSERRLDSIQEWQGAIDAEKFPLLLASDIQLKTVSGFLAVQLEGRPTGFECRHEDAEQGMDGSLDFGRHWRFAVSFRIIGAFAELRAAWMAATAYAHATDGVVFDPQEDKIYSHIQARGMVHEIERDWPAMQAAVQEVVKKIVAKPG